MKKRGRGRPTIHVGSARRNLAKRAAREKYASKTKRIYLHVNTFEEWREIGKVNRLGTDDDIAVFLLSAYQSAEHRSSKPLGKSASAKDRLQPDSSEESDSSSDDDGSAPLAGHTSSSEETATAPPDSPISRVYKRYDTFMKKSASVVLQTNTRNSRRKATPLKFVSKNVSRERNVEKNDAFQIPKGVVVVKPEPPDDDVEQNFRYETRPEMDTGRRKRTTDARSADDFADERAKDMNPEQPGSHDERWMLPVKKARSQDEEDDEEDDISYDGDDAIEQAAKCRLKDFKDVI